MDQKMAFLIACIAASSALATPITGDISNANSGDWNNPCPWIVKPPTPPEQIVANWYSLWAGNYSVLDETVTPNVQLFQDRFPISKTSSANLPVFNSSALLGFVTSARQDFESYSFIDDFHFGVSNAMTLRWTLNATFKGSPSAKAKKGTHIAYNGTDILLLEPCSGLVQEILSAQDLITYYHELGETVGSP